MDHAEKLRVASRNGKKLDVDQTLPLRLFVIDIVPSSMCGILALLLAQQYGLAANEINEALSLLQHRGQDAAGIVTCGAHGRFYQCKANGMVRDVFNANALSRLQGNMGVGHGM